MSDRTILYRTPKTSRDQYRASTGQSGLEAPPPAEAERQRWVEVLTSLLTGSHPDGQVACRAGCHFVSFRRVQESEHVEG